MNNITDINVFRSKHKAPNFYKFFFQLGHYNSNVVLMGADEKEAATKLPEKAIVLGKPVLLNQRVN